MKRTLRAYWAGMMDGEGYVGLIPYIQPYRKARHKYYKAVVKIQLTDEEVSRQILNELKEEFKGGIYKRKPKNPLHKESIGWEIRDRKRVRRFLIRIFPYLRLKRKRAEIMLEFIEEPIKKKRIILAERLKRLNKRGNHPQRLNE